MTCAFEGLDSDYVQLYKEKSFIGWHYIGTYNGLYRGYPFIPMCYDYDVRLRPWYCDASAPKKNLIIVLDISEMMNLEL